MTKPAKIAVPSGTFGFSFRMRANGLGGTFPKLYSITGANTFLLGLVSEFSPVTFFGWASDPGDNVFPTFSRDYGPANGGVVADGLCPNNVRLSQVPLSSLVASFGIGPGLDQVNLPTSTNYNNPNFNTSPGAVNTLGNFGGFKRATISLLDPLLAGLVLVNGALLNSGAANNFEGRWPVEVSNMGAITVVNLTPATITVGVMVEMDL